MLCWGSQPSLSLGLTVVQGCRCVSEVSYCISSLGPTSVQRDGGPPSLCIEGKSMLCHALAFLIWGEEIRTAPDWLST